MTLRNLPTPIANTAVRPAFALAERGLLGDSLIRLGIRRLVSRRLREQQEGGVEAQRERQRTLIAAMRASPIALHVDTANRQHYEVPAEFYAHVLGPRRKYSACLWPEGVTELADAEEAMLSLTAARAQIADGHTILDLGCGWGAFALWAAERFPRCRIFALSNSQAQRAYIEVQASHLRLADRLQVSTGDVSTFVPGQRFDRVVSIEMFEHMRNVEALLDRIAGWLTPTGKLFVHQFCHREHAYFYETEGADDWMGRTFFTGGMMPSDDLLLSFQRSLVLEDRWLVGGLHYQRTLEAWLGNLDHARAVVLPILGRSHDKRSAALWLQRWRLFLMACSELFAYGRGNEWYVAHYRLAPR